MASIEGYTGAWVSMERLIEASAEIGTIVGRTRGVINDSDSCSLFDSGNLSLGGKLSLCLSLDCGRRKNMRYNT